MFAKKKMIDPKELIYLLGKSYLSNEVKQFISSNMALNETIQNLRDDQVWVISHDKGFELLFKPDKLDFIHLNMAQPGTRTTHEFTEDYTHDLPFGLAFGQSKDEIVSQFGKQDLGTGVHWGIYFVENYSFRVGYLNSQLCSLNLLSESATNEMKELIKT